MGNAQSKTPDAGSPSPSNSESRLLPTSRRDHPRNLIHSQRTTAAAAEASLAQARGTTVTHRPRNSQSNPAAAHLSQQTPSHPLNNTSHAGNESQINAQQTQGNRDQPSKPVDVPAPSSNFDSSSLRSYSQSRSVEPLGPSHIEEDMSFHLNPLLKPPRLPLPIEEEKHSPGSPLLAPSGLAGIDELGVDAPALDLGVSEFERASSTTTIDEDDADELNIDTTAGKVPITLEWVRGGGKVYVTGSISQWNKKHKLTAVPGKEGHFKVTINVHPGTHHLRFMVDGVMQVSQDMPTTVDFNNYLVNYIDVAAQDLPTDPPTAQELIHPQVDSIEESTPAEPSDSRKKTSESGKEIPPTIRTKPNYSPGLFYDEIPQVLTDLEADEHTSRYRAATSAIGKLQNPPSLPGFLTKPVLNVNASIKDDNSVLTQPNHTVLNHLATSSIKNEVLAISATTRYKRKYVTTIMYKPAKED